VSEPLLAVRGLDAGYGKLPVLRDVTLSVEPGEMVAVLGPNGAGKSTLLRAISNVEATVTAGEIVFAGISLAKRSPETIARAGLLQVPEGRRLFNELSVEDNIRLGGHARPRAEIEPALQEQYARFPRLAERKTSSAFSLSGGEQQMLALARALMAKPKLLMLDEPSTGLAPKIVESIFTLISELRDRGTAVLLVEQNAYLTLKHADRAYVLESGAIVLSGSAAELSLDARVRAIYLGGHAGSA
jgi:branched-chain amino acid transport system ATP-binding protein